MGISKTSFRDQKGFTLIEAAVLLIIVGLLVKPIIEAYKIRIETAKVTQDLGRFNTVLDSINSYVVSQGRYPLPAGLTLARASVNDGVEAVGAIQDCTAWPTPNGVCTTGGANAILIGAVPFREIGVDDRNAYDYFGNRILYAVTASQATAYTIGAGRITTRGYGQDSATGDRTATPVDINTASVDMMLVSHGETGQGAYLPTGVQFAACPTPANGLDSENCNLDDIFILRRNRTVFPEEGSLSLAAGAEFYDDQTMAQQSVPVDLWASNLGDPDFAVTTATRIGIGESMPISKMHVVGDLLANNIQSDQICDDSTNCFDPAIIAGTETSMDCSLNGLPGNQAVIDVGGSQVFCAVPVDSSAAANPLGGGKAFTFPPAFTRINCADSAQLMVGINASGEPQCVTP